MSSALIDDEQVALERRLRRAALQAQAHRQAYEDEIETRDGLVLQAVDGGVPFRTVARWALISRSRVLQIIADRG